MRAEAIVDIVYILPKAIKKIFFFIAYWSKQFFAFDKRAHWPTVINYSKLDSKN